MDFVSKLATEGTVELILAISILGNVLLFREIKSLQEQRVEDAKEVRDTILEPLKLLQQTVDLILSILQNKKRR